MTTRVVGKSRPQPTTARVETRAGAGRDDPMLLEGLGVEVARPADPRPPGLDETSRIASASP